MQEVLGFHAVESAEEGLEQLTVLMELQDEESDVERPQLLPSAIEKGVWMVDDLFHSPDLICLKQLTC